MAFNKKEYDKKYMKEKRKNIKPFKVDLPISEFEELDTTLKNFKLSKTEFLKQSFKKFKEEKKMKKYYIYCGTDHYKLIDKNWQFDGETSMNINDDYIGIYTDYNEAFKIYNSINLRKNISDNNMYADYKQIYEIDESIDDKDDIDLDEAILINEEYTFAE